ncbi:MAG: 4-hydroxy-tetrahydrodipicolinate reductase [Bacteroidetes bacterium]|jgi:4-hydroxy-tetrahydrodipicolinate reductase|nr:4-hydroxy-tetrahydrodipicolinate reductase [Bacteroidota bacterium]
MEKLKIALIGYGRMGKEIAAIAETRGHHIIAKLDSERDWMNHIDAFVAADVAIEFSVPEKAVSNIHKCFDANIPVVVGTTGWYHQLPEVLNRSKEQNQTIFYAPNYSIGMNMMFALSKQLTAMAVRYGYKMELYEKHHIHKLDKPSGTAIELARIIKTQHPEIEGYSLDKHDDPKLLPVEVIREDEVNGIHELILNSDEDSLKLRHEAFNRKGFAKGALMAAEFLNGKKGVFTMDDIFKQMI